jgi:hemerythrin superfamily protein
MTDTTTEPNAIELLTTDHDAVEQMFRQIEALPEGDARSELVASVVRELSVHAAIEEQVLYPAMRKALPDGDHLVQDAIAEHQRVKEALAAIERAHSPSERDPHLVFLIGNVRHHVEEEEVELFPKLRASITTAALQELGGKLAAAKNQSPASR